MGLGLALLADLDAAAGNGINDSTRGSNLLLVATT